MSYYAYTLTDQVRNTLLQQFQPKFPDIVAHHVTVWFGGNPPPEIVEQIDKQQLIRVVGYVADDSLEALVVEVDRNAIRPDGKRYHITWSLDRKLGRKPVDSNNLIALNQIVGVVDIPPFELTLEQHS